MKRAKNIKDEIIDIDTGAVVIGSDIHIPFQDDDAVLAFCAYIERHPVHTVILNGDVLDMFMLSRFTKGEGRNPLEEIEECRKLLQRIKKAAGEHANLYYVIGNHETRLERYVLNKAPELASLIEDVFTIIKAEDYGFTGCASVTINDKIVVKHGTLLGNKSGLSAIKEMEASYMSGATGHTHRLCKYIARKAGRKFFWMETGCLCGLNPEYMVNPDWQQGFARIDFIGGKVENAKVIEIENGDVLD